MAPHITIEDRPCGTGKTTDLISGLKADRRCRSHQRRPAVPDPHNDSAR